jgi:hypothetical protein
VISSASVLLFSEDWVKHYSGGKSLVVLAVTAGFDAGAGCTCGQQKRHAAGVALNG